MKTLALVAGLAATLLLPLPGRAADALRTYAQHMLAQTPQNFAALRGAQKSRESYQITYGLTRSAAKTCASCEIVNEFAWPHHAENWYLNDDWNVPKSWSHAKTASYVVAQLTPLLAGYARATSGTHDYPSYRWTNAKTKTWVVVDTYNGGFNTKFGHDLASAAPGHELHDLSLDEVQTMRDAIGNFVKLGTGAAAGDFATLRGAGKPDELGTMTYKLTVDFGAALTDCTVTDNTVNNLKLDDFSPNWALDCSTTPAVVSVTALENEVHQAVAGALGSNFEVTTGKLLGLNEYRWDDGSDNVAVTIGSLEGMFLPKGLAQIHVGITHFTQ